MARKRRRARARKDEESVSIIEKTETKESPVDTDDKPQETLVEAKKVEKKQETTVTKTEAKPTTPKPVTVKKGPSVFERIGNFLREVKAEMKKVSWPDRERTTQSTGVVIFTLVVLSGLMAFFTFICTELAHYFFGSARGG